MGEYEERKSGGARPERRSATLRQQHCYQANQDNRLNSADDFVAGDIDRLLLLPHRYECHPYERALKNIPPTTSNGLNLGQGPFHQRSPVPTNINNGSIGIFEEFD